MPTSRNEPTVTPRTTRELHHALKQADQKLTVLEDELSDFLEEYLEQVGDPMQKLMALREELSTIQAETFSPANMLVELREVCDTLPANQLKDQIKQLYHELARAWHPDLQDNTDEASIVERMQQLNAAYNMRDLTKLWRLKWELMQEQSAGKLSHKERLKLFREQSEQMHQSLSSLEEREASLKESDAFRLMQHARFVKLSGQDFMAQTRKRILGDIERTKAAIATARRQQHYWRVLDRQERVGL